MVTSDDIQDGIDFGIQMLGKPFCKELILQNQGRNAVNVVWAQDAQDKSTVTKPPSNSPGQTSSSGRQAPGRKSSFLILRSTVQTSYNLKS